MDQLENEKSLSGKCFSGTKYLGLVYDHGEPTIKGNCWPQTKTV